jgi:hypothetical protein
MHIKRLADILVFCSSPILVKIISVTSQFYILYVTYYITVHES